MNKEINLIYKQQKDLIKKEQQVRLANLLAIMSLAVVVITSAVLFIINRTSSLPAILQQEKVATQNLSFLQKRVGNLLLVKSRLHDIDTIIKSQDNLDSTLQKLEEGLPTNVTVESLSITKTHITLTVSSPSLVSINQFLDFLISESGKKELVKKVTVNSLLADTKLGKYTLSIDSDLF